MNARQRRAQLRQAFRDLSENDRRELETFRQFLKELGKELTTKQEVYDRVYSMDKRKEKGS